MSRESLKLSQLGIMEYLTGAWIANGPVLLLLFIQSFLPAEALLASKNVLFAIMSFSIFAGATIAGYIVTRGVQANYVIVGGITGAFSFLMNSFMFLLLFPTERGLHIWLIPVFVSGGSIGGLLRKKQRIIQGRKIGNARPDPKDLKG